MYSSRSHVGKIKARGDYRRLLVLLKSIEKNRLNGLLEMNVTTRTSSIDLNAVILQGFMVVMQAFTAYRYFLGETALKVAKLFSLEEEAEYWAEFTPLRNEEIMGEIENMDEEAILKHPIKPLELLV